MHINNIMMSNNSCISTSYTTYLNDTSNIMNQNKPVMLNYHSSILNHINSITMLNKANIPTSYTVKIDRMKLSVRNFGFNYQYLKDLFSQEFTFVKTYKDEKNNTVNEYTFKNKVIQIVYYHCTEKQINKDYLQPHYFFINVHDPDFELQSIIRYLLSPLNNNSSITSVYLSQIEFALDIYPLNKKDLDTIKYNADKMMYLKFSRIGSYSFVNTTFYLAKKGHIHKSSRGGVRCYPKGKNNNVFVRIELQANRETIKNDLKLELCDLPVDPTKFDFFRYIEFRDYDLNKMSIDLEKYISTKTKNVKRKKMHSNNIATIFRRRMITRILNGERDDIYFDNEPPVAHVISQFKKLQKQYNISYSLNKFFPKLIDMQMK